MNEDALRNATYYVRRVEVMEQRYNNLTRLWLYKDVNVKLQVRDDGETLRVILEDRYE